MNIDRVLYFKGTINKDLLDSTGTSAQYPVITLWFPGGMDGERAVRESGMDMDTLLCLTWRTSKDLLDSTGTLLHITRQPGWEGSVGEKGYIYTYG